MPALLFENFYDIFYEDSMNFWNGFSDEQKAQSAFVVSQFGHTYTGYTDWPLNIGDSLTPTYNADYVVNFFDSVREGTEPTKVELGKVTYYPVDGERWYSEDTTITNGMNVSVKYGKPRSSCVTFWSPSILPTLLGYSKPCRLTTVLLSGIKSRVSLTAIFCSKSTRAFVRP